jgi:hypothetical protein
METEVPLSRSQKPATYPYPEPDQSGPQQAQSIIPRSKPLAHFPLLTSTQSFSQSSRLFEIFRDMLSFTVVGYQDFIEPPK